MVRREKSIRFVLLFCVFLFILVFFTKVHPIVISTTDDYFGFANHRQVLPTWRGSEPIRVFGAVFLPLVSQVMSLFYRVFGGNLFDYLTFGWALCVAGAMTGLTAVLYCLFRKAGVSPLLACVGLVFFLLMHFWIFKKQGQDGNTYMLHSVYACTYFIYVIPNLLNAILVLWLHSDKDLHDLFKPGKYLKKSLFVFAAYFCIHSNIWAGAILASYLGMRLITDIISGIRTKVPFGKWIHSNSTILLLILMWLVSQVFEMNGQRAAGIGQSALGGLSGVLKTAMDTFGKVNLRYIFFCGIIVVGGMIAFFARRDKGTLSGIGKLFFALVLFIVYFLLSCSKLQQYNEYVVRPDVFYGAFFFGSLIVLLCLFELMRRFPIGKLVLPLALLFVLVDCNSMGKAYQDSVVNKLGETAETHSRINQDILLQMQQAEADGLKEAKIYVPAYNHPENWPYATYATEQISKGFYKLGAMKEEIYIELVPDPEKNKEFGLDVP